MKRLILSMVLLSTAYLLQAQTSALFATGFNEPYGLAFDASGNLYVANANGNSVSKVDASGSVTGTYTGFNTPVGLAFDAAGNLYVANATANTVSKINASGTVTATYTGFGYPVGLAFDASGYLYVANEFTSTVNKVDAGGNIIATYTGFVQPIGLTFDATGNLFVANISDNTVNKVDASGNITATYYGFNSPTDLSFDASGNLYITNSDGNNVSIIPAGSVNGTTATNYISGLPYAPFMLTYHDHVLYVSDGTSSIYKITDGALPLTLVNFTAQPQGNMVMLNWETATEMNTSGFEIERSIDAIDYENVGKIKAVGNGGNNYHFKDDISSKSNSTVYYRLKMVDDDGSSKYSKVASVQLNSDHEGPTVYPNPAKDYININTGQTGNVDIYNTSGILVSTVMLAEGINKIDVSDLASGSYFIVSGNNKVKFIKQ